MGTQVPANVVRFDASFGRRLLYDPAYNSLGAIQRCAWFEANLIATEYDGWFPGAALQLRFAPFQDDSYYNADRFVEVIIAPLQEVGLLDDEEERDGWPWFHIKGWEKWQPDPLEARSKPMTSAERVAKHRAKKRGVTPVTEPVTPVTPVTPHAGASSSSSSSVSKKPSHVRGGPGLKRVSDAVDEFRQHLAKNGTDHTS